MMIYSVGVVLWEEDAGNVISAGQERGDDDDIISQGCYFCWCGLVVVGGGVLSIIIMVSTMVDFVCRRVKQLVLFLGSSE